MVRPGERTAEGYRDEAARVRAEAEGVLQAQIRSALIGVAMKYDAMARIAERLESIRGGR